MNLGIRNAFLSHTDPDASLGFWRDTLGFALVQDVGEGSMRWLTLTAPDGSTRLVLNPVGIPGTTDDEQRVVTEMMAKGTFGILTLGTDDLDGTFERLVAAGAEVVQEPTDQFYGVRDCAFRDPSGNLVRIDQL